MKLSELKEKFGMVEDTSYIPKYLDVGDTILVWGYQDHPIGHRTPSTLIEAKVLETDLIVADNKDRTVWIFMYEDSMEIASSYNEVSLADLHGARIVNQYLWINESGTKVGLMDGAWMVEDRAEAERALVENAKALLKFEADEEDPLTPEYLDFLRGIINRYEQANG
jgi:hypothetical protein